MEGFFEAVYSFDHSVLLFIQENLRFEPLTPIMQGVSYTVNLGLLWVITGLALLCFKKTRMAGAVMLSALLVGLLINNVVVKNIVNRARPYETYADMIPLIKKPFDSSFASGHTTSSFAAAGTMARFLPKPAAAAVICYAVLVALSRLYLGVHYPTDVLFGMLIGLSGSFVAYAVYSKYFDLEKHKLREPMNKSRPAG